MSDHEDESTVTVEAPVEPGFYRYSGGNQNMVFLLNHHWGSGNEPQWFVIADNAQMSPCAWGYIEQCLGVWDLVPLREPEVVEGPEVPDAPVEFILSQEQVDAIEKLLVYYAQMMLGYITKTIHMEPGPEKTEQTEACAVIEATLMEVARTMFPERHAAAVEAKRRYMGGLGFN